MPKGKRGKMKRTIGHAHVNVEKGIRQLATLETMFKPTHPLYAEHLQIICVLLDRANEMIDDFCDKAWGGHPSDYETWRNMRRRTDALTDA